MRNSNRFAFVLAALVGAAGCAADTTSDELDSLEGSGKADQVGAARDTMLVFDNGIRCVTAPCPTLSVITAPGKVERVTDIVLPDPLRRVGRAGLVVKGEIVKGANGAVTLEVATIVGEAPVYDAYFNNRVCVVAPCPSYTATDVNGNDIDFASTSFEAAARSEEDEARLHQKMDEGSLVVRGFVAQGEWARHKSGNILYVTSVLESDVVRFERDARPVDGDYRSIRLERDEQGTYAASLRVSYYDRLAGQEVNQNEELGDGLTCDFALAAITCSRDDRPVDGLLVELVLTLNAQGTYDATLERAWVNRMTGQPAGETKELGSDLAHQ